MAIMTSLPGSYPAALMAAIMLFKASSVPSRFGAKPPSSPTAVLSPRSFNTFFNAWNTSAPMRRPSRKEVAPTGRIMNSWKAIGASLCEPPLMIFIIGTGITYVLVPPM